MKDTTIKTLDDNEKNAVAALMDLGQDRKTSHVIMFLLGNQNATAKEIEMGTGLAQPEVSVGAMDLIESGWIKVSSINGAKGRPKRMYSISISKEEIIQAWKSVADSKCEAEKKKVEKLRSLLI